MTAVTSVGDRSLASLERRHIENVLRETAWNVSETARILEVDRGTVYNKIKHYGIEREEGDIERAGAGEDR
jgi:transcriptional regulator of acetoin/glycerol metabolism